MNLLNLDEIADFQNGYAFSSKEYVTQSTESKEVLRMGYIKRGGGFKEDDNKVFAPKESKGFTKKYMLEQDDIVIAMTDMKNDVKILGCCALVNHNSRFLLNQRVGRVRVKDTNLVNPKYLYYFLNSPDQLRDIRSRANSGVQVNLSTQSIKESLIKIYPKEYQDKIVEVLHSLDKKIELNQQINKNLEEIAKTLFKSWFIDFDPVRAKAEGKPTGLSKEVSDLFPDSFENSELGQIPEGFKVDSVDNQYDISIGKTPPRKETQWFSDNHQDIPWVSIRDMGDAGVYINKTSEFLTNEAIEKFNIKVIPKNSVILSFKLTVGRVSILGNEMCTNEAIAHFVPKDDDLSEGFTYCLLKSIRYESLSSTSSIATAVNSKIIKAMKCIFPSKALLIAFNEFCHPIYKKIETNSNENKIILNLRETLLPKLISGEIKIPDAENLIEESGI